MTSNKIWVNGTFDILHIGHIKLLEYASSLGELKVGIDSDNRVKQLKGTDRPINTEQDRKDALLALKSVNSVSIFDTDEQLTELIKEWNTDFMVVGSDYIDRRVIGSEYSKKVIFFNRISDYSSTKIISKL